MAHKMDVLKVKVGWYKMPQPFFFCTPGLSRSLFEVQCFRLDRYVLLFCVFSKFIVSAYCILLCQISQSIAKDNIYCFYQNSCNCIMETCSYPKTFSKRKKKFFGIRICSQTPWPTAIICRNIKESLTIKSFPSMVE